MPVIDSHQHFWDLDVLKYTWLTEKSGTLFRNYLPTDLAPLLRQAGVDRTVVVQANDALEENRWALKLASEHAIIAGVVGNAPLHDPKVGDVLDEFVDEPRFCGVRIGVGADTMEDDKVPVALRRGMHALSHRALSLDLLIRGEQLRHVSALAHAAPDLHIVIDHIGVPRIGPTLDPDWCEMIRAAATMPNVYCKLSGMVTVCGDHEPTSELLKPWVMTVLDAFGAERCMFGSDWPVSLRGKPYGEVKALLEAAVADLSPGERDNIFGNTAIRFYRLLD
jgi:L-fuconolactonase